MLLVYKFQQQSGVYSHKVVIEQQNQKYVKSNEEDEEVAQENL